MRKKTKVIIVCVIAFILSTIGASYYLLNSDKILTNFDIVSVTNDFRIYKIKYNKVKAADHYVIQIHDSNNIKVFEMSTTNNEEEIELSNLSYDTDYTIMVYAYDSLGDYRPVNKPYTFKWAVSSFDKDNTIMLNDDDYELIINGDLESDDYHINIIKDGVVIEDTKLNDNSYTISKTYYEGTPTKLEVNLLCNGTVVDSMNLYNNENPVGDITITSPQAGSVVTLNDLYLSFDGGENASEYIINIYNGKKLMRKTSTTRKNVILSKNFFKLSENYSIEVIGKYEDYTKESKVDFIMSDKFQMAPAYITKNPRYIKKGTKLEIVCNDSEAQIYYTTNGESPDSFGTLYTEPIEINENMTLKTVAVSKDNTKYNSIINTYDINVGNKENLIVYLSPSNQDGNWGVKEVGFTNEMREMNDLSNYIEERLKSHGVKIVRNNPAGNINIWNRESNYAGADLHIAIHSNASTNHDNHGIETWIHSEGSKTLGLANLIQSNLVSIYPYKDTVGANRGVKYANGALGEVNDNYLPFGILVEVAHHDNKEDAKWIMDNKKLIGYNIADSILKYYQIID